MYRGRARERGRGTSSRSSKIKTKIKTASTHNTFRLILNGHPSHT
jgi:hypothetical protein